MPLATGSDDRMRPASSDRVLEDGLEGSTASGGARVQFDVEIVRERP